MIGLTQQEQDKMPTDTRDDNNGLLLPSIKELACVSGWVNAPVLAVLLILGRLSLALSIVGGSLVSFLLCSFLGIMVGRLLAVFSTEYQGNSNAMSDQTTILKFVGLGMAKFIAIGLVMLAIVWLHANLYGVLVGFVITQIAVVIFSAKLKKR